MTKKIYMSDISKGKLGSLFFKTAKHLENDFIVDIKELEENPERLYIYAIRETGSNMWQLRQILNNDDYRHDAIYQMNNKDFYIVFLEGNSETQQLYYRKLSKSEITALQDYCKAYRSKTTGEMLADAKKMLKLNNKEYMNV